MTASSSSNVRAVVGVGDADADGEAGNTVVDERCREFAADAVAHHCGTFGRRLREHHEELVATVTGDEILGSHHTSGDLIEALDRCVADFEPVGTVVEAEVVEMHERNREGSCSLHEIFDGRLENLRTRLFGRDARDLVVAFSDEREGDRQLVGLCRVWSAHRWVRSCGVRL